MPINLTVVTAAKAVKQIGRAPIGMSESVGVQISNDLLREVPNTVSYGTLRLSSTVGFRVGVARVASVASGIALAKLVFDAGTYLGAAYVCATN